MSSNNQCVLGSRWCAHGGLAQRAIVACREDDLERMMGVHQSVCESAYASEMITNTCEAFVMYRITCVDDIDIILSLYVGFLGYLPSYHHICVRKRPWRGPGRRTHCSTRLDLPQTSHI